MILAGLLTCLAQLLAFHWGPSLRTDCRATDSVNRREKTKQMKKHLHVMKTVPYGDTKSIPYFTVSRLIFFI